MTEKVVGLRGHLVTDGRTPDPAVIKLLSDMLDRAQTGEITGAAIVIHYHDGASYADAEGVTSWGDVGRMEYLKQRAIKVIIES